MSETTNTLSDRLQSLFGARLLEMGETAAGDVAIEVRPADLRAVMLDLRDGEGLKFEQLIDVAGVDYAAYGQDEWITEQASGTGFSRGVETPTFARLGITGIYGVDEVKSNTGRRFASVYQLLSVSLNQRLQVKVFAADDELPVIDSVVDIWSSARWFEREAFDLYGIIYDGHDDLRRILTDYGFVGHPFRKDFPLIGNVEVRYDEEKGRVIYQPVTLEPRVLVPRVIRDDSRYAGRINEEPSDG